MVKSKVASEAMRSWTQRRMQLEVIRLWFTAEFMGKSQESWAPLISIHQYSKYSKYLVEIKWNQISWASTILKCTPVSWSPINLTDLHILMWTASLQKPPKPWDATGGTAMAPTELPGGLVPRKSQRRTAQQLWRLLSSLGLTSCGPSYSPAANKPYEDMAIWLLILY